MRDSGYLSDLGGLSASRQLIRLDLRGTGQSARPADPASYRCDRLTDDVAALQDHLGLGPRQPAGAFGGGQHRGAVRGPAAGAGSQAGIDHAEHPRGGPGSEQRDAPRDPQPPPGRALVPGGGAAFEQIQAGPGTEDDWAALAPLRHGRWDAAAQAIEAAHDRAGQPGGRGRIRQPGAFDPAADRVRLAAFGSPVLLLAGEVDVNTPPPVAAEFARLFPRAELVIQPGAGHYPWLDDPVWFSSAVTAFLV